jgi:hypothetical protein
MILVLGRACAVLFAVWMAVIGGFMLISPRAWFQLPAWLAGRGTLTKKRYSTGWGAVQVRVLGGVILGTLLWVIFEIVTSPN